MLSAEIQVGITAGFDALTKQKTGVDGIAELGILLQDGQYLSIEIPVTANDEDVSNNVHVGMVKFPSSFQSSVINAA